METKQTAVDWLYKKLQSECLIDMADELFLQAKQIEKEQIINAYEDGIEYEISIYSTMDAEEYYKTTYGKD